MSAYGGRLKIPYTRSRPTCNLSDQILELEIESRRGLKQRRIFAGHHQRRWQVINDRHALAILVLTRSSSMGANNAASRSCRIMVIAMIGLPSIHRASFR